MNRLLPGICIASWLLCLGVLAQAQSIATAPGFDPTPVVLRPVTPTPARPITQLDLIGMRDFRGIRISPDGRSVAFVVSQAVFETNSYRSALFVVHTLAGSRPISLGTAGPPHWDEIGQYNEVTPQWSPDSRFITLLSKRGGTWQIWQWPREGGKPRQLTRQPGDVLEYEWSVDGTKIIFTTAEAKGGPEVEKVAVEGLVWDGSIRAHKGLPILQAYLDNLPKQKQVWIYEVETGIERRASAAEESVYNEARQRPADAPGAFALKKSPDRKAIAFISQLADPKESPYYRYALFTQEVAGGRQTILTTPSTYYMLDLWWSKDGQQIYFAQANREGRIALYTVPAKGGSQRELTRSKDLLHTFSFDREQRLAACIREHPTLPPELDIVDLQTGEARTLVVINPEFQNIKLSPAVRLEWTNKYGENTFGHLVKPLDYESGKRYPLIVTTYRSWGFLRGAAGDEYPIQVFAANGFAVLNFEVPPLRVNKPGDPKANLLQWYAPMASLETAMKLLEEMGIVDPLRKGLTGLSHGAEITEFTISHSDLFQAASDSGSSGRDPIFYYLSYNGWHKIFGEMLGGGPEGKAADIWKELSPALNASQVKAPLLIQSADTEYLPGLQFYTALRDLGKPVELVIYPNEQHIKNQPQHRYYVYQRNLDWFKFWLQDREDTDPRKTEQYARWRKMKDYSRSATTARSQ